MIASPAGTNFIHAETYVDQKHQSYGQPIIELGKNRSQCIKIIPHNSLPNLSLFNGDMLVGLK